MDRCKHCFIVQLKTYRNCGSILPNTTSKDNSEVINRRKYGASNCKEGWKHFHLNIQHWNLQQEKCRKKNTWHEQICIHYSTQLINLITLHRALNIKNCRLEAYIAHNFVLIQGLSSQIKFYQKLYKKKISKIMLLSLNMRPLVDVIGGQHEHQNCPNLIAYHRNYKKKATKTQNFNYVHRL